MTTIRSKRFVPEMPHSGHKKHLCYLVNVGFQTSRPKDYLMLVKDPMFICKKCGRAAKDARNLCSPRKLQS